MARAVETPGWAEMGQSVPGTERELLEPTSPSQSPEAMAEASKRHSGLALLNAPGASVAKDSKHTWGLEEGARV